MALCTRLREWKRGTEALEERDRGAERENIFFVTDEDRSSFPSPDAEAGRVLSPTARWIKMWPSVQLYVCSSVA